MTVIDLAYVRAMFSDDDLTPAARIYLENQGARIAHVLQMVGDLAARRGPLSQPLRVIDIAPHLLTNALKRHFGERVVVDTLGWFDATLVPIEAVRTHIDMDLNDTNFEDRWPRADLYDCVIMGEIFEHLYACPIKTLSFARTLLADSKSRIILQTPNAAGIRNRLRLLIGHNPFEMIKPHRQGHVREYTMHEILSLACTVGLQCEASYYNDYHPERGLLRVLELLRSSFRRRMTLLLFRDDE